jgi:hypothetical protein
LHNKQVLHLRGRPKVVEQVRAVEAGKAAAEAAADRRTRLQQVRRT